MKFKFKYTYKVFDIIQAILAALTVYNLILWIVSFFLMVRFPEVYNESFMMSFMGMTLLFFIALGINTGFIYTLKD